MIEELARDYAAYAKVDISNQMKNVHETIEDMMVRLEEFESIIGMVQTTGAECTSEHRPGLKSVNPELLTLCKRIDALEHVVARANVDLTALEAAVDTAEAELGGVGVSDRLLGMLNPISHLFKLKNTDTATTTRSVGTFEQPSIYRTDDFFENESNASSMMEDKKGTDTDTSPLGRF